VQEVNLILHAIGHAEVPEYDRLDFIIGRHLDLLGLVLGTEHGLLLWQLQRVLIQLGRIDVKVVDNQVPDLRLR
jgi:hypothetical protein